MDILSIILTVVGLCLFETVSSIDNAVVNAEVLLTMGEKAKKWFLTWGIFIAVFLLRGILPWLIIWMANPSVGPWGALVSTFSNNPEIMEAVEKSSPLLLLGGGIFLVLLFLHWLFLEPKSYGLPGEKFFNKQGAWFYAVSSVFLAVVVWLSLAIDPMLAFAATIGSTAFFIVHGFKQQAEQAETELKKGSGLSDISKLLYLEVLDATFSIDGVVGAFAFTLSVPLIIIGNGLGALVVRSLTIRGAEKIRKYVFLKNGAMYSILFLGMAMLLDSFGIKIPSYVSPLITFAVVGYFFLKSRSRLNSLGLSAA